jgi:hypothetical protein
MGGDIQICCADRTKWRVIPIHAQPASLDYGRMVQVAIRCHPRVPVAMDELGTWLECEIDGLRAEAQGGTVRISSLTQHLPSTEIEIGWLVELELPEGAPLLQDWRLSSVLRDMRLLGLTPTLLIRQPPRDRHQEGGTLGLELSR